MISCQLSLYPLGTESYDDVVSRAVEHILPLKDEGLTIEVGSMSSVVKGPDDVVWKAVRTLFDAAKDEKVVLNTTFSNECGCDL